MADLDVERVDYHGLRNSEFPGIIQRTIAIAEKYEIEEMHLGKSFTALTAFVPLLDNMKACTRKNEKLAEAGLFDKERDVLIRASNKIVQAFKTVPIPEVKANYEILSDIFARQRANNAGAANLTSETERINALEREFDGNEEAREAATAFGLEPVFGRMFEVNHAYETAFREYIANKSAETHVDIASLRQNCINAVGQFFDAIEFCAYEYDDIDYVPLVNEVNTLNGYYRTRLKARATRRKNNRADKGDIISPPEA